MILQANAEIETLDHKHKALSKKHDKLVEEMDERKEKHKKALEKTKGKIKQMETEVTEQNAASALLETRIRQLKQAVRFSQLGVSAEDAGKENSLILSNSMGNNVLMSGVVPKQVDMNNRMFNMPAQQFGFTTPTNTVGARNGFTNSESNQMQQMANMMQQQQQQQQMRRPKASSSGCNMQMFQQYLKFQQMQQQFGFQ